jgi:hypothetical protein
MVGEPEERTTALLPRQQVAELWDGLTWHAAKLKIAQSKNRPFIPEGTPAASGLYRITWINDQTWRGVSKTFTARGAKAIANLSVSFSNRSVPCVMTIGRTTNLRKRLRDHFGSNPNNNRFLTRLRQVMPGQPDGELRVLAAESVRVEWVAVTSWVERSLLEVFGKAIQVPIFDLDAEH